MSSEWMKVMLDEISRKKAESEAARIEDEKRRDEGERREPGEPPERHGDERAAPSDADLARG